MLAASNQESFISIPSFLNKSLCSTNHFAASSILFGLLFSNATLCLYDSFHFNFIGIVSVSSNILGSCFTVALTSAGTLTTLPFKFNWPPKLHKCKSW